MTRVEVGENVHIDEGAVIGYEYDTGVGPTIIGDDSTIRSGTKIYADVKLGRGFTTGHDALVREWTTVGDDVVLGTKAVLDGAVTIGSNVSIQTGVYVPPETDLGDRVFLGPHTVMTNDPYPLRIDNGLEGPTVEDDVSIGANATILPDVTIGEGAFVAAGSVVVDDVPPRTLAVGVPAKHRALPEELVSGNVLA